MIVCGFIQKLKYRMGKLLQKATMKFFICMKVILFRLEKMALIINILTGVNFLEQYDIRIRITQPTLLAIIIIF